LRRKRYGAKSAEMLAFRETGFAEAALRRAAGNTASIVGSGGMLPIDLPDVHLTRRGCGLGPAAQ